MTPLLARLRSPKLLIPLALLAGGGLVWALAGQDILALLRDRERLAETIRGLGIWGPIAVIGLRALAGLLAVVPSSPVLLGAGIAYGTVWGSAYALAGALLGALAAYMIGRGLGFDFVERRGWVGAARKTRFGRWMLDGESSQTKLMGAVFLARLMPFLNLDAMSYVAGVTPLRIWRFAAATVAGLLPYTLVVVTLGGELLEGFGRTTLLLAGALVVVALVPLALRLLKRQSSGAPATGP